MGVEISNDNVAAKVSDCEAPASTAKLATSNDVVGYEQYTLKVDYGTDMRRLHVRWPKESDCAEVMSAVVESVRYGFGSSFAAKAMPSISYIDDDGDRCSLVQQTLQDCLGFARNGVLKLELQPGANATTNCFETVDTSTAASS